MDRIKAKNYLGIALKAGYAIIGSDKLDGYKQKLYLVLIDKEAGKSSKKIAGRLQEGGVQVLEVERLGELANIETCKLLGIKNKNLADKIYELLISN